MIKITRTHVGNLLKLISGGIINGAGSTEELTEFCIQQAVHRVIDGDLDEYKSDSCPQSCIHREINSLGIHLNDCGHWNSDLDRAKGLKRFAIAELGSAKMNWNDFTEKLEDKIRALGRPGTEDFVIDADDECFIQNFMQLKPAGMQRNTWITILADMCANTMKELGTEGGEFLWMVDEPDRAKRRHAAYSLGLQKQANQMADARSACNWGSDCSFGLPQKGHHGFRPRKI